MISNCVGGRARHFSASRPSQPDQLLHDRGDDISHSTPFVVARITRSTKGDYGIATVGNDEKQAEVQALLIESRLRLLGDLVEHPLGSVTVNRHALLVCLIVSFIVDIHRRHPC